MTTEPRVFSRPARVSVHASARICVIVLFVSVGHLRVRAPVHARLPGRLRGRARKSSQCQAARLYEPVPPRLALARLFGGTGSMGEDFLSRAASGAHALPVSKRSGAMHLDPPAIGVGKRPYFNPENRH